MLNSQRSSQIRCPSLKSCLKNFDVGGLNGTFEANLDYGFKYHWFLLGALINQRLLELVFVCVSKVRNSWRHKFQKIRAVQSLIKNFDWAELPSSPWWLSLNDRQSKMKNSIEHLFHKCEHSWLDFWDKRWLQTRNEAKSTSQGPLWQRNSGYTKRFMDANHTW